FASSVSGGSGDVLKKNEDKLLEVPKKIDHKDDMSVKNETSVVDGKNNTVDKSDNVGSSEKNSYSFVFFIFAFFVVIFISLFLFFKKKQKQKEYWFE
ncbi:MAG TPA: hypothetical protein VIY47_10525, partial [Ignavibacteriaceae bacterium]